MVDRTSSEGPVDPSRDGVSAAADPKDLYDEVTVAVSVSAFDRPSSGDAGAGMSDNDGDVRIEAAILQSASDECLPRGYLLNNRFEIDELVHSGGMGHVYKALDKRRQMSCSEQIHVAIKMMRRAVTQQLDSRFALEREAAKTQRLSHPNIVNVYDFDQHGEQLYLVLEWLEGESVNALLRRTSGRPLAPQFAWQVIEGIARGLLHAHSNNVVHADINPSNIFITDTQEIKLLDFGVARYENESQSSGKVDKGGVAWATRTYASCEVLSGIPPTFGDDIYSLGCVAYRLLTGRHPFGGWTSVDAKQAGAVPQPIPGLSEESWSTLRRALSFEPSERPDTVSAFLTDSPAASGTPAGNRKSRRQGASGWSIPTLRGLGMAAVVCAAAGLAWWFWPAATVDQPVTTEPVLEPETVVDAPVVTVDTSIEVPPTADVILDRAALAMADERYLAPDGYNARALYLDVLALDPDNSLALSGLRDISDVYVRQAESALRAGDPVVAIAALTVAAETDAENPAISIVDELLLAQSNMALANARVAVADGDLTRARNLMAAAEQYGSFDAAALTAVTQRIIAVEQAQELDARYAAVEADLAAGRLMSPVGENAQEKLLELQLADESDPRSQALSEQLTVELLDRANVETESGLFDEAALTLDAAGALGLFEAEISAARTALQLAVYREADQPAETGGIVAAAADNQIVETSMLDPAAAPGEIAFIETAGTPAESNNVAGTTASSVRDEPMPLSDLQVSEPQLSDSPEGLEMTEFSDLAIENYVAPRYPSRAMKNELNGAVTLQFDVTADGRTGAIEVMHAEPRNVFVPSARNAVRQWRFAEREEVTRTQVTLRFELPPDL